MTAPVLKKVLGEAGSYLADDHGESNLYDAMRNMVKAGVPVPARQAGAVSASVKVAIVATFDGVIGDLVTRLGTTGSAGSTDLAVNKNGVALAKTQSVANTVADDEAVSTDLSTDPEAAFVKGDLIEIEVTGVGTGPADLDTTLSLRPAKIQA